MKIKWINLRVFLCISIVAKPEIFILGERLQSFEKKVPLTEQLHNILKFNYEKALDFLLSKCGVNKSFDEISHIFL